MSEKRFLIFDMGASNGRSIVAEYTGDRFELTETYRFDNRPVLAMDTLYWDALRLFSEIKLGLLGSIKQYGSVESLAVDTWGCDFGLIDDKGYLIGNPVTYRDIKRYERASKLHEIMPEFELYSLAGTPLDRIMSIYQLFSFKYEGATDYEKARHFLMIPDLFNYMLTGVISNEFTNATMSLMCNQNTRTWESAIFERFGFDPKLFSDLLEPGTTLGDVKKSVCDELGVNPIKVVVPATHDTASAVSGIPVKAGTETGSWAFISMGTWCICGVETPAPVISQKSFETGFGNEGGVEGKNMLVRNLVGLWIIQECRERWRKDMNRKIAWEEIVQETNKAQPFRSFIDVDEERFGLVQPSMPETVQQYCRETNQPVPDSMGEIARCVYESLAMKFRNKLSNIEDLTGRKLEVLHLVGGGIENKLLCEWTANAAGIPIVAGPTETTSVGNLLFQLKNAGDIQSVEQGRELCRNSFQLEHYEPKEAARWREEYQRFIEVTTKQ